MNMKKSDFGLELALLYAIIGAIMLVVGVLMIFAVRELSVIIISLIFALAGGYLIYNFIAKLKKVKKLSKLNPNILDEEKTIRLTKKDGSVVWLCPKCKKQVVANSQFCNFCGEIIDGSFVEKTED